MTIHFVCRGNVFRSLIAEAYLRSLQLPGVTAVSSGTVGEPHKEQNKPNLARTLSVLKRHGIDQFASAGSNQYRQELLVDNDVVVFVNRIAYDDRDASLPLPGKVLIWDVADFNELERPPKTEAARLERAEEVYRQITGKVDELVRDYLV